MRRWAAVLLVCLTALTASCAHAPQGGGTAGRGKSYRCVATWYGPGFHGNRTASGAVYDMDGMTCAHRTYPFGQRLRVTNPADGRSCVVVVNDRGPFVDGREIDLSRGASRTIGVSFGEVIIEELDRDMSYIKTVHMPASGGEGQYRVQVGAFADPENAGRIKMGLELNYADVRIDRVNVGGADVNRVRVGQFGDKVMAARLASRLANEGYETWVVRE